ncbi:MAG: uL15m family ribosomal protein [Candidatus Pacearchaeota archaeon]
MRKRDKRSRLRGRRTCGYGSRKKHRGKGSKGGKGMSGLGGPKRASMLKYYPKWFGKKGKGFVSKKKKKLKEINLDEINKKIEEFQKKGMLKGNELNLEGYKILGAGNLKQKLIIKASKFSKNAKEKIISSGSIIESSKEEKEEGA